MKIRTAFARWIMLCVALVTWVACKPASQSDSLNDNKDFKPGGQRRGGGQSRR